MRIKPLGDKYSGPDVKENVIILCPWHHAEFDYGSIAIDPQSRTVNHIDPDNEFHGNNLNYERSDLNPEFLEFHMSNIFGQR